MDENNAAPQADHHSTTGISRLDVQPIINGETLVYRKNQIKILEYYNRFELLERYISKRGKVVSPTSQEFQTLSEQVLKFENNAKHIAQHVPGTVYPPVVYKHLAFTLFAPAGKAARARKAVDDLTNAKIFEDIQNGVDILQAEVAEIIRPNVRFHMQKANRFCEAVKKLEAKRLKRTAVEEAHTWLLKNINGLGKKATAHFMRNVGLSTDYGAYPIIDVHIKKLLEACGFVMGTYEIEEQSFRNLSELLQIPVLLLDAYAWCMYSGDWSPENADFDNFGH